MKIKGIIFEDFINYKKPCMTIEMPYCDFKCDRECGERVCQNSALAAAADIEIEMDSIIKQYKTNDIPQAIVFQGLEPFDSWHDLFYLIKRFRDKNIQDTIVIYTGYTEEELTNQLTYLKQYENIIVKFGRFIPNQESHYDKILGVNLASNNQYAKKIS